MPIAQVKKQKWKTDISKRPLRSQRSEHRIVAHYLQQNRGSVEPQKKWFPTKPRYHKIPPSIGMYKYTSPMDSMTCIWVGLFCWFQRIPIFISKLILRATGRLCPCCSLTGWNSLNPRFFRKKGVPPKSSWNEKDMWKVSGIKLSNVKTYYPSTLTCLLLLLLLHSLRSACHSETSVILHLVMQESHKFPPECDPFQDVMLVRNKQTLLVLVIGESKFWKKKCIAIVHYTLGYSPSRMPMASFLGWF